MQPNQNLPLLVQFFPFIFIFLMMYVFFIRPQQKKQKEHQDMISSLKKNDEVVTGGGIHGTVVNIKDKTFILRVDDNAKIEIDKAAVAYLKKKRDDKTS